jgi:putative flavoprotein involved in K+ transport
VHARKVPSPQLVGTPERTMLDLNRLTSAGVELRGRLGAVRDGVAMFSGGLGNACHLADLEMHRLLDTIDEWATEHGHDPPPDRDDLPPTEVADAPLTLDLSDGSISTVLWATGCRPDYSWLDVDVFDRRGRIHHHGGILDAPGMYLLGTTFPRRRKSSFINGDEDDCNDLADHMVGYLAGSATA